MHGLPAYEISNHARPGAECRHNLVYWRGDEYAGIGPGAHGRIDSDGVRHATATEKRPEAWLMRVEQLGHGVITDDELTREERADEYLLMGLRLREGIDPGALPRACAGAASTRTASSCCARKVPSPSTMTGVCASRSRVFRCSTQSSPISPLTELSAETARRGGGNLGAALADTHDGKTALVAAVALEAEQPVDAGKA